MADATATFAVNLQTASAVSGSASLSQNLVALRDRILGATKELSTMQASLGRLQAASVVQQFESLGASVKSQESKLESSKAKLASLQAQMAKLQSGNSVPVAKFQELSAAIATTEHAIEGGDKALGTMRGKLQVLGTDKTVKQFQDLKKAIGAQKDGIGQLESKFTGLGGNIEELGKEPPKLTAVMSKLGFRGLARDIEGAKEASSLFGDALGGSAGKLVLVAGVTLAVVAAVVALVAVLGLAIYKVSAYALTCSDAARSQALLLGAATNSAAGVASLTSITTQLEGKTGLAKAQLDELGLSLARSGLQGKALESAFKALAVESSVMGDSGSSALQSIIDRAKQTKRLTIGMFDLKGTGLDKMDVAKALAQQMGISVQAAMAKINAGAVNGAAGIDAISKAVQDKLGGTAAKQALGFGHQMTKLSDDLAGLFSGINLEGFLTGLQDVLKMFGQDQVEGRALKQLVTDLLQPFFDSAAKGMPTVREVFQQAIIWALKAEVAFLQLRLYLRDVFGADVLAPANVLKATLIVIGVIVGVIALAFTLLGIAIVAALAFAFAPLALFVAAVMYLPGVVSDVADRIGAFFSGIAWPDWSSVGSFLVDGLIAGLDPSRLITAVVGLAGSATSALKNALGIHSPSTVWRGAGKYSGEGYAMGLEDSALRVGDATEGMVSIPSDAGAAPAPASSKGAKGGGSTITFSNCFNGLKEEQVKDSSFIDQLVDAVEKTLEGRGVPLLDMT